MKSGSLRRRMLVQIGSMIAASLVIAAGALWGINGLKQDFSAATQGHRELRAAYEVGARVETARTLLDSADVPIERVSGELIRARVGLQSAGKPSLPELENALEGAIPHLKSLNSMSSPTRLADIRQSLTRVLSESAEVAKQSRLDIVAHEQSAEARRRIALLVVTGVSIVVTGCVIASGMRHYRSIVRPIELLRAHAHRLAGGEFSQPIVMRGDFEFTRLADDFNTMGEQLRGFYCELERKVELKSRELARSARMASLGYLAAGVAHEINNPLSIIAGYGERALQQLAPETDKVHHHRTEKALRIICEETFRCKQITDRLLSLGRPETQEKKRVDLGEIARSMLATLGGLNAARERRVTLAIDPRIDLAVHARENEMKQVMLNLAINSIEATSPQGEIHLSVCRDGDEVVLEVSDDGQGMTRDTLERVFEPFFTGRRGANRHGTGLGLSIARAIIEEHSGTIAANSDGPSRGSRFIVRLPAFEKGGALVV